MSRLYQRIAGGVRAEHATTLLILGLVWGFLLLYFDPSLLLLDTMDAGGDTPSFLRPIHHLRDVLLPAGQPQGFDLANFAGYPPYQFYFLPPSLAIVLLSYVMPLNVAFKLFTVLGTFLLPLAATLALLAMRLRFPLPALGGAATLLFLFNEGNSMWGGNIPSTLAGEFAFSLAFALAVAFVGLLYRGVERQRGWRGLGALLALIGLCHPIAFLNASAAGLFFLLSRRHFARNLRFLLATYGLGVLLMGFWLIPLVAKLPYATAIDWKWHFTSWRELLPPILLPVAPLALLDLVWLAVRRRPEDRPMLYLAFAGLCSVVLFINATTVGLPEIRFAPFVQIVMLLLAADALRRLLPLEPASWPQDSSLRFAPHVGALALALAMAAFAQSSSSTISSWIRWNYEGVESKPSYPLLRDLTEQVRGTISDPRVAYENSPRHDRFGSMRIFEDMALFSGRATLEGVLLQTSINSPSIYFLQNQISKQGTGVIPGYLYPEFHPERATPRLALYNVHDLIAVTPELRQSLEADAGWERVLARDDYAIFHRIDADPHYVRVPRYQPAVLDSADWKRDFHRWFASDDALEVPLLLASRTPRSLRGLLPRAESPGSPPRVPIDAHCEIQERIDHLEIEFTTSCPGLPHWIAVSYFPNWQVEGAPDVLLSSPGFMLVVPDGPRVLLRYRRIPADWLGIALTVVALGICLVPRRGELGELRSRMASALEATQPALLAIGLAAVVALTGFNLTRDLAPSYFYRRGWTALQAGDWESARGSFERALWLGGSTEVGAESGLRLGWALLQSGSTEEALSMYEWVIAEHPGSVWVVESRYQAGVCLGLLERREEAQERFESLAADHPRSPWGRRALERIDELRAKAAAAPLGPGG